MRQAQEPVILCKEYVKLFALIMLVQLGGKCKVLLIFYLFIPQSMLKSFLPLSSFARVTLSFACLFFGSIFYHLSLEGGSHPQDLGWFYKNLPKLRTYLGISIICCVLSFELIIFSRIRSVFRNGLVIIFIFYNTLNLSVDNGVDLQHHGSYNAAIFIPSVIIILVSHIIYRVGITNAGKCVCFSVS